MTTQTNPTQGTIMSNKLTVTELFMRESERVSTIAHATGKQINGISDREYKGFNRINLYLVAKEKGYTNTWYTYDQVKNSNFMIKEGEHGTPVFNNKLVDKEEGRKEKVLSYYLVFNQSQLQEKLESKEVEVF